MDDAVDRMLKYSLSIAAEFQAWANRIRNYVPNHHPTAGMANEMILRDFLAKLSSTCDAVSQGFICDPCQPDVVSRQCDILVYDQLSYPLVHADGEVRVVFPHSVKMVVEVKTGLDRTALEQAFENVRAAKAMNFLLNGVIFAFESPKLPSVIRGLRSITSRVPLEHSPIAVLLLDQGVVIHRWPGTELGGGSNPFSVCVGKGDSSEVVVAFMLLLFYDVLMNGVWGGASVLNLCQQLLKERTRTVAESL